MYLSLVLGMVMVSPALKPQSCWEFQGDIMVLHHPTTIAARYQEHDRNTLHIFFYSYTSWIGFLACFCLLTD